MAQGAGAAKCPIFEPANMSNTTRPLISAHTLTCQSILNWLSSKELFLGDDPMRTMRQIVGNASTRARKEYTETGKSAQEERTGLHKLLSMLSQVPAITPTFVEQTKLPSFLQAMTDPSKGFSQYVKDQATELITKFQAQNWGKAVVDNNLSHSAKKGHATQSSPSKKKTSTAENILPLADHPLFNDNGILRGLAVRLTHNKQNPRSLCFHPDKEALRRDCHEFGHNDLTVGDWWPVQIGALRDGAHGSLRSGIHGNEADGGAFSILVKDSKYLNHDTIDLIHYATPQPTDTSEISVGARALRQSLVTRNKVRVIRGDAGSGDSSRSHAPSTGLRYDGLYSVVRERAEQIPGGEKVFSYILARDRDQPPVNLARPSAAEEALASRINNAIQSLRGL